MHTKPVEQTETKTKRLEDMSREELLEYATLLQRVFQVSLVDGKFAPMKPDIRTQAWRHGAVSTAQFKNMITRVLGCVGERLPNGESLPCMLPPPDTFV